MSDRTTELRNSIKSLYGDLCDAENGPDRNTFGFKHRLKVIHENLEEMMPRLLAEFPHLGEFSTLGDFEQEYHHRGDSGMDQLLKSEIKKLAIEINTNLERDDVINEDGLQQIEDESTQSYEILKNLEQNIRKFLEIELSEQNPKWWKQLIPGDVKDNAETRKKDDEERKTWQFQNQQLISYIDFTDYEKIITKKDNWANIFKYVFHDEIAISSKLKEIEPIRNAISHTRNLDTYEEKQLRFYSEEILRSISYYYENKDKIVKQKTEEKIKKEFLPVPIHVSFDRTVYPISSKVYVRARIPKIVENKPIIFQVFDSKKKLLVTEKIDPKKFDNKELKSEGLYETSFVMKGSDWKVGETIMLKAIHGSSVAYGKTTIDKRNPVVQSDKSVYLWGSDMILTVIDPDADKDSRKAEFVGNRTDAKLIIQSSKGKLIDYKLRETGDSTGIFQAIIGFIGVKENGKTVPYIHNGKSFDKTQGKGIDDGFLEVSENDKLKITYSNLTKTVKLTVFVVKELL